MKFKREHLPGDLHTGIPAFRQRIAMPACTSILVYIHALQCITIHCNASHYIKLHSSRLHDITTTRFHPSRAPPSLGEAVYIASHSMPYIFTPNCCSLFQAAAGRRGLGRGAGGESGCGGRPVAAGCAAVPGTAVRARGGCGCQSRMVDPMLVGR